MPVEPSGADVSALEAAEDALEGSAAGSVATMLQGGSDEVSVVMDEVSVADEVSVIMDEVSIADEVSVIMREDEPSVSSVAEEVAPTAASEGPVNLDATDLAPQAQDASSTPSTVLSLAAGGSPEPSPQVQAEARRLVEEVRHIGEWVILGDRACTAAGGVQRV